jgi:hypothetical protein
MLHKLSIFRRLYSLSTHVSHTASLLCTVQQWYDYVMFATCLQDEGNDHIHRGHPLLRSYCTTAQNIRHSFTVIYSFI